MPRTVPTPRHWLAGAFVLLCFLPAVPATAAGPTQQFVLDGQAVHPGTYALPSLQALPAVTQTDHFGSGSGAQTHMYTGASLWSVLNTAGIKTDPLVKNDVLNHYVSATGSDGYRAVYSLGELSPNFGNTQSLVAYAEVVNGSSVPLGTDGFARTTAPLDGKGGRYVSNLSELTVQASASTRQSTGGGVSTQFDVTGDVAQAKSFSLAALEGLPRVTRNVGADIYTGVSLWDLLNTTVGLDTHPAVKNDVLGMYVVATGSDGYKALFSMGELSPGFGNQPDIVAFELNGVPLTGNGFARIVAPNDVKAGRFVSNLVSLEVFHAVSAVPEPTSVSLMAMGALLLLWRVRSSRRR